MGRRWVWERRAWDRKLSPQRYVNLGQLGTESTQGLGILRALKGHCAGDEHANKKRPNEEKT